jgi:hypothetical protein
MAAQAPARASSAVRLFDAHCHLQGAPLFQAAAQAPPPLQGAGRAAAHAAIAPAAQANAVAPADLAAAAVFVAAVAPAAQAVAPRDPARAAASLADAQAVALAAHAA